MSFSFTDKPKGRRRGNCKSCERASQLAYRLVNKDKKARQEKEWRQNNPDKAKERERKKNIKNAAKIRVRRKIYRQNNKEKIAKALLKWQLNNPEYRKPYMKKYRAQRKLIDPSFRLRGLISRSINHAMKRNGSKKNGSCTKYLSYSMQTLLQHIENQFEPWMTWDNNGLYKAKTWDDNDATTWTWQIDHIIPHSTFKYTSMSDDAFQKCWALSNLRPYSAKLNYLDGVRRTRH